MCEHGTYNLWSHLYSSADREAGYVLIWHNHFCTCLWYIDTRFLSVLNVQIVELLADFNFIQIPRGVVLIRSGLSNRLWPLSICVLSFNWVTRSLIYRTLPPESCQSQIITESEEFIKNNNCLIKQNPSAKSCCHWHCQFQCCISSINWLDCRGDNSYATSKIKTGKNIILI